MQKHRLKSKKYRKMDCASFKSYMQGFTLQWERAFKYEEYILVCAINNTNIPTVLRTRLSPALLSRHRHGPNHGPPLSAFISLSLPYRIWQNVRLRLWPSSKATFFMNTSLIFQHFLTSISLKIHGFSIFYVPFSIRDHSVSPKGLNNRTQHSKL